MMEQNRKRSGSVNTCRQNRLQFQIEASGYVSEVACARMPARFLGT